MRIRFATNVPGTHKPAEGRLGEGRQARAGSAVLCEAGAPLSAEPPLAAGESKEGGFGAGLEI